MPIRFQWYENMFGYDTILWGIPTEFFPIYILHKSKLYCKRNYLFCCPHEHMTPFQHVVKSKYEVSIFSTFFQTQDIKTFWAWNLESHVWLTLSPRAGFFVTLDSIHCYSVLERQHALGTRMVSLKYHVYFNCHSLESKARFFHFVRVYAFTFVIKILY